MVKAKKFLALVTALSVSVSAFTGLSTVAFADGEEAAAASAVYEDGKLTVTYEANASASLIVAKYKADNTLQSVTSDVITFDETGKKEIEKSLEPNDKIMLWNSLEEMVPILTEAYIVPTPTPTPTPTPRPRSYTTLYSQDYESAETADWTSGNTDRYTTAIASDASNKWMEVSPVGNGSNGTTITSPDYSSYVSEQTDYAVEFDLALTDNADQAAHFHVYTASGELLNLQAKTAGSGIWALNSSESQALTLAAGTWYHYTIVYKDGITNLTVDDVNGARVFGPEILVPKDNESKLKSMAFGTQRYSSALKFDNLLIRTLDNVDEEDYLGERGTETLDSVKFVTELNTTINQPTLEEPVHKAITVSASGIYGNDLTNADGIDIKWTVTGLDNEDGYISLTKEEGTELGTVGENPDGSATAYFNVRNGVSNWFGSVTATVTYLDKELSITTPFAVIGASGSGTNIAPAAGYPENMSDYDDALVGYKATASGIKDQDLVLNKWSIYGGNGARTLTLLQDEDETKYLQFSTGGGSGSTIGVYQLEEQSSQYIADMKVKFTGGAMTVGHYFTTPNNSGSDPNWTISYASNALTVGTRSITGLNSTDWFRIVVSADESAGTFWVKVFDEDGALVGSVDDEPLASTASNTQNYFCFYGTFPVDLASFRIYYPTPASLSITTDKETIQVPETAETPETAQLSAILKDTDGWNMTGKVTWSLDEEYAGVTINENTGVISVDNTAGSGTIVAVATFGATRAEKEIALSTSGNSMTFTKSTASLTIPFEGEDDVTAEYAAEARNKDGQAIPGATVTYSMVDANNQAVTVPGVTFDAATGKLTVTSSASSKVVYIRAVSEVDDGEGGTETLTSRAKVNIHGLSFTFGTDEPEGDTEGFTQVTAADAYTDKVGYGFADTSAVTTEAADVKGSADYRFKAKVPNGNYVVKVETSAESITSEVVESVTASTGITKSGSQFSVAVCDGVLDLTFPSGATLSTLTITQAEAKIAGAKPAVYAIGDSTTNNTGNGAKSWGNCVSDGNVTLPESLGSFSNNGMAGRDSVNYYNQGRVEAVLLAICPGDYVTVNMGINSKETGEGASYETLVSEYYVQAIIDRGAIPVIVTATPDGPVAGTASNNWNGDYNVATETFTNNRGTGARNGVLRKIAQEKDLNIIELGYWGEAYFNSLTMDDVTAYNTANDKSFASVIELVQSWYVDHNHYYQPLGEKIGEYILDCVSQIAGGSTAFNQANDTHISEQ